VGGGGGGGGAGDSYAKAVPCFPPKKNPWACSAQTKIIFVKGGGARKVASVSWEKNLGFFSKTIWPPTGETFLRAGRLGRGKIKPRGFGRVGFGFFVGVGEKKNFRKIEVFPGAKYQKIKPQNRKFKHFPRLGGVFFGVAHQ